ncbi:MAG: tetraacyldisaccharide 4'-kinase [Desulforhopalus sp.]
MSKGLELLFFLGRPFSPLYSAIMTAREKLYTAGVFGRQTLQVPVISVGNLVLGGTGKTPTVQYLARLLLQQGYHPAVISRGHGGKARDAVNIVSDGNKILLSATLAGDEPYMLAESLPGVPVLTGLRRMFPCRRAISQFNADVIILDDGFQHLSVARDIDIVLFDGTALAGNSRVFPGGPLREPTASLKRCNAFLLTGKNSSNEERIKKFAELLQLKFPGRPVFNSSLESYDLIESNGKISKDLSSEDFFGFCGIANPDRFEKSLADKKIKLRDFLALKDHTSYTQNLVSYLCKKANECGAKKLVTTEKDFVKLRNFDFQLPLYVLHLQYKVEQSLDLFVLNCLKNINK